MDKSAKSVRNQYTMLLYELKSLGIMFIIPIIMYIIIYAFLYFSYFKHDLFIEIETFKKIVGVIPVIGVSFWIITLFGDFVDSQSKECLLSLPYNNFNFGILKVLKINGIYLLIFYIFIAACSYSIKLNITFNFVITPLLEIIFFCSFSFFSVVLTKNIAGAYIFVGVFTCLSYMTRGGAVGWIYPFQWAHPKPGVNYNAINITLIFCALFFYIVAHWIFKNKEYLVR
jgi:hypothetical protein